VKRFKEVGFNYVSVDLQGFRSGSLNEVIQKKAV
jgi:PP-loop superfamily ATP-utilizing enzyme